MPVEQLFLSLTAVMMLFAAVGGVSLAGAPEADSRPRPARPTTAPENPSPRVDGEILRVDFKDRTLMALVGRERKQFKVAASAVVMKGEKQVGLESLARGDQAVLHLASAGSDIVNRIDAVPSH